MTKVTPATEKKHPNAFVAPVFLTNLWLKTRKSKGGIPARKHAKKNYMSAIYVLIGFSLLVAIGFLVAFVWAVKNGQYEDDYTPSVRMLFDDAPQGKKQESREASSN